MTDETDERKAGEGTKAIPYNFREKLNILGGCGLGMLFPPISYYYVLLPLNLASEKIGPLEFLLYGAFSFANVRVGFTVGTIEADYLRQRRVQRQITRVQKMISLIPDE